MQFLFNTVPIETSLPITHIQVLTKISLMCICTVEHIKLRNRSNKPQKIKENSLRRKISPTTLLLTAWTHVVALLKHSGTETSDSNYCTSVLDYYRLKMSASTLHSYSTSLRF
jgi:hypothetical protein